MAKLLLAADGSVSREFELKPGVNTIGRGPANDIQIPVGSISTCHCEVTFDPALKALVIRDLGSTNGTFVEGQRVGEAQVDNGQFIRLGDVQLQCQTEAALPKPRVRVSGAAPVPNTAQPPTAPPIPAIPVIPASSANPAGGPMCVNHPEVSATMICRKCGRAACDYCVKIQHIANRTAKFCGVCGDECVSVSTYFAPKKAAEKNFYQRLPGAFAFPFKGDGLMILIAGTVFFGALGFVQRFAWFYSLFLMVFGMGYLFAYMQSIIGGAGMGEEKPPQYPDITNFYADIVHPFLLWAGTLLFCFGPALGFRVYLAMHEDIPNGPIIWTSLLVAGALYLPMALLAVGIHETVFALNPLLVVISILRVPIEYLVCCILLAIVVGCDSLSEMLTQVPVLGGLLSGFTSLYFMMVEMRILGLLFRSKKKQLGWKVG